MKFTLRIGNANIDGPELDIWADTVEEQFILGLLDGMVVRVGRVHQGHESYGKIRNMILHFEKDAGTPA